MREPINNKLESIRKDNAVAYFKDLSRHLPVGTEETHEALVRTDNLAVQRTSCRRSGMR
jgi:hypothetical protein